MTNRINALTVVLDQDYREDDVEAVVAAIEQLRGVASVKTRVANVNSHIAYTRARQDLEEKLYAVLNPEK